jgi:glycolate oxidase FAD binding subunit
MSATASASWQQIERIVAPMNFVSDAATLAAYEVDGMRPTAAARPASAEEAAEIVRLASAEKLAVIASGARTKLGIGAPPARYDLALDLSRLDRVLAYDPADLTLSVEAGIRLADLQKVLGEQGQFLPFATPFARTCTVGGVLGANSSGPLRHLYGAARDFTLGMEFIDGAGTRTKSGGRVVKNVAGMDLHKLLIGSLGTLGVMTAVNFKTFPLPRATGTFVISYVRLIDALAMRAALAASALTPHVVEIISPEAAPLLDADGRHLPAARWSLAVAAGGEQRVVERHGAELERLALETRADNFAALKEKEKGGLWEALREFSAGLLAANPRTVFWKISALPGNFAAVIAEADRIARENSVPAATVIRAAGIVYLALLPREGDAEMMERLERASTQLFARCAAQGARAVIEWCPLDLKRRISVWGTPAEDFSLMQRVKKALDPGNTFAPGRFVGGL